MAQRVGTPLLFRCDLGVFVQLPAEIPQHNDASVRLLCLDRLPVVISQFCGVHGLLGRWQSFRQCDWQWRSLGQRVSCSRIYHVCSCGEHIRSPLAHVLNNLLQVSLHIKGARSVVLTKYYRVYAVRCISCYDWQFVGRSRACGDCR